MMYNGWANYETWRVNLEVFDDLSIDSVGFEPTDDQDDDVHTLTGILKNYAEETLEASLGDASTLARGLAFAFLDDVDYREIALAMLEGVEYPTEKDEHLFGKEVNFT